MKVIYMQKIFLMNTMPLSYNNLVKFATFGQDYYWKKKISSKISTKGLILDLAWVWDSFIFIKRKRTHCIWSRFNL